MKWLIERVQAQPNTYFDGVHQSESDKELAKDIKEGKDMEWKTSSKHQEEIECEQVRRKNMQGVEADDYDLAVLDDETYEKFMVVLKRKIHDYGAYQINEDMLQTCHTTYCNVT